MNTKLLKRHTKNKKKVSIGRGGKRGKTAGRGTKGQKSRAGHKIRPEIRDFIKTLPKLRGRGKNSNQSIQTKPIAVNVRALEEAFKAGEVVTRSAIIAKGIIRANSSTQAPIKILATGDVSKKLTISGCLVSASAKAKIEKAGGSVTA
jgi:large subunit ribosomal protein L15